MFNMKKSVLVISLLSSALALSACSSGTSQTSHTQEPSVQAHSQDQAQNQVSSKSWHSSKESASDSKSKSDVSISLTQANALVLSASHGNVKVLRIFPSVDGMVGAITQSMGGQGAKQIVYISPHGGAVFPNGGYDKNGKSLAQQDMVAQDVYISASELYSKVKDNTFIVGKSGPVVTAFLDPNCIWCHELYVKMEPYIKSGDVRLRAVMVGFLKPSSEAKAVTILAAKNPAKALAKDEKNFDKAHEEGGIKVLDKLPPKYLSQVKENLKAMSEAGPVSTPGLLFCDKSKDNDLTYLRGMPPDMGKFLKTVSSTGHPSCNTKTDK